MKKHLMAAAAVAALAGAPMTASAVHIYQYTASLSGANEVPANAATGTGLATLFYDTIANTFDFSLAAFGLTGTATGYHIHAPATTTQNAGVVVDLSSTDFIQLVGTNSLLVGGDDVAAPANFLMHLEMGHAYVNVHTTMNPGGELRGQLMRVGEVPAIPEPGTYAMLLAGVGAVGLVVRRRRRQLAAA